MFETLFFTDSPGAVAPDLLAERAASGVFLSTVGSVHEQALPPGWMICEPAELVQAEQLRRAYLDFLEKWPLIAGVSGGSFDDLFTRDGRYSVWWTSFGADRQITHGPFQLFQTIALLDRALQRYAPTTILLLTRDPDVALLVESRAVGAGVVIERLPECAKPSVVDLSVGLGWYMRATLRALQHWLRSAVPALRYRWALRRAALFGTSEQPTVVFTSRFERYLLLTDGALTPAYWRHISDAITAIDATINQAYLPWRLDRLVDSGNDSEQPRIGIEAVRHVRAPLLLHEVFVPVRGQLAAVLRQVAACWRFYQLARTQRFQQSFRFANTDMIPAVLPPLRDAVARIVDWTFRTGQFRCALRRAGNVRVVVAADEMYPPAMPVLAAAAALGVPVVGVQHGTIMPAHLTYTLPRGHIQYAPVPDAFAVYGSYAKEIVSSLGAYPPSAVWITGPARMDALVNCRVPKADARVRLGIPAGKRVVVLATQTYAWFPAVIRSVLDCVRSYPDVVLCVKKHPKSRAMSVGQIMALASEIGANEVRVFENDLELLLFASDLWVSATSSTTILESALVGTPSICVNFSGEPDWYPYVEEGASLPARSPEELKRSMSQALALAPDSDGERKRVAFLIKHAGLAKDGRAAMSLAERIVEVCHNPGRPRLHQPAA